MKTSHFTMLLTMVFAGPLPWNASHARAQEIASQEVVFTGEVKLPRVVRFRTLPMRMVDELTLEFPKRQLQLRPGLVEYFDQLARSESEPELLAEAARSLGRIAGGKHADISGSIGTLESLLKHESSTVQRSAAQALIKADSKSSAAALLSFSQTRRDQIRSMIEDALVDWEFEDAKQVWLDRISSPSKSNSAMLSRACAGLAKIVADESLGQLLALNADLNQSFATRIAAARAIVILDAAKARSIAEKLSSGTLRDRLMAVSLLSTDDDSSLNLLVQFCDDESNAVAAAAWRELEKRKPELLRERVPQGCEHADSQVRLTAIKVIGRYPGIENANLLATLSGDRHIDVRNNARVQLLEHAAESDELKQRIITNAESGIGPNSRWERIEQSLLVLACLHQAQVTTQSVTLLEHERPEVYVTAAWVMHLYPNALVLPEVTRIATKRRVPVTPQSPPDMQRDIGFQMAHLYQMAGYLEHKPFMELCKREFSKGSGLNRDGRAAGMWAIGWLNRDNPDPGLVRQLVQRLNDRGGNFPEFDLVRRMALMSLGRMMAKSEARQARRAHGLDGVATVIPKSARWVLKQLGETDIPPERQLGSYIVPVGGWRVSPNPKKK